MASSRDLRRRIKSIRNTAQITKAMQMVAASKMRRAQNTALAGRPYEDLMDEVLHAVAHHAGDFTDPLIEAREVKKRAVILISTDKGLCGALNSNLLREASKLDKDTTVFLTAGRKASQFVARTRRQLAAEFTYKDTPQFTEARAIARFARDMYLNREVDRVDILYTRFYSTLSQKPEYHPFLPINNIRGVSLNAGQDKSSGAAPVNEYQFEPDAGTVLGAMLPHYLNHLIYQLLLESKASEQSARMVAMKNATDNAQGLIKDLTLEYNKLRQACITKELLEISSAAMALG